LPPSPSITAKTRKAAETLDITLKTEIFSSGAPAAFQNTWFESLWRSLAPEDRKRISSSFGSFSGLSRTPFRIPAIDEMSIETREQQRWQDCGDGENISKRSF
jgi:hypothetical protein